MAGSPETIPLALVAELGQLRDQLKTLPGITAEQARLMTAELNQSFKRAANEAKKAAEAVRAGWAPAKKAVNETADAADELGDQFGGAGSSAAKLAGAAGILSPKLGEAARNLADVADIGEVAAAALKTASATKGGLMALATTLGPVALAIGLAAAAFTAYQVETQKAKEETEKAQAAAASAADAFKSLGTALFEARIKQMELRGELTKAQADSLRAGRSIAEQFNPALAEAAQRLAAAREEARNFEQASRGGRAGGFGAVATRRLNEMNEAAAQAEREFNALRDQYLELQGTTATNIALEGEQKQALDDERDATKAATRAKRDAAEAEREFQKARTESLAAMDEDTAALVEVESNLERMAAATRAAGVERLRVAAEVAASQAAELQGQQRLAAEAAARALAERAAIAAIQEARAQDLLNLERTYQEQVRLAAGNDAQLLALAERYEANRQAIVRLSEERIDAERQAAARAEEERRGEMIDSWREFVLNLSNTVAYGIEGVLSNVIDRIGESNKKAAMTLFRISQAAALVQATIAAYRAAAEAAASAAALGPVAAAAAGAITFAAVEAISVAKIATQQPPTFGDTPGLMKMRRGGVVQLAEDDYFAAAQEPAALAAQIAPAYEGSPYALPTSPSSGRREDELRLPQRRERWEGGGNLTVINARGTVVDERVTRFQKGRPSELSRGLDQARGNVVAKKRR